MVTAATVTTLRDREIRVVRREVVVMTSTLGMRADGRQSGEAWVRWDIGPEWACRPAMSNTCSVRLSTRSDHLVP